MLFTYNPKEVAVVYNKVPLSGFVKGTFVSIDFDEDDWEFETGSDGQTIRSRNPNATATATITLQQSSISNQVLSGFRALDRTTGLGAGNFLTKDLRGTTLVSAPNGVILKPTKIEFADKPSGREWKIKLVDPLYNPGGNVPNIPGVG